LGKTLFHGSAKLSFEEIREELEMTFEYEEDAMSPTDWKLAGEKPWRPGRKLFKALNRTMTLSAERRAEVLWEARKLIVFARSYTVAVHRPTPPAVSVPTQRTPQTSSSL
jgi:hypothetical protein